MFKKRKSAEKVVRRVLDGRELMLVLVSALALGLLWQTPLLFPLRFFSVLVHECSHAIAGLLTGGSVDKITLDARSGGLTFIHGGAPVIFSAAGYLGSVLFGGMLLYLSRYRNSAHLVCMATGLVLTLMTLRFISPVFDFFGFCYGAIAGVVIGGVGFRFRRFAPYFLKFLGVSLSLFSFMDIQRTLFSGPAALAHSDAGILAKSTDVPALFWACAWLAFATVMFAWFAYFSATRAADGRRSSAAAEVHPTRRIAVGKSPGPLDRSVPFARIREQLRRLTQIDLKLEPGKAKDISENRQNRNKL